MTFTEGNNQVLLICNQFRDYPQSIKTNLEAMGANVDFFRDQPPFLLYRKLPKILKDMLRKRWLARSLRHMMARKYDYIFLVKGQGLNKAFMDRLMASQPQARKLFYTWDSLANYNCTWLFPYFDTCYSFDSADARVRAELLYLPLFHDGDLQQQGPRPIDLFTLSGGGYGFRKPVLDHLVKNMAPHHLNIRFYLLNKRKYLRQLFKKEKHFTYLWKPMPYERYKGLLRQSNTVVDIHHQGQTGLTMRTIESLGMGCKLATTNNALLAEKPEAEDWIYVLDRENPEIKMAFLQKKPSVALDLEAYQISNFLQQLFTITPSAKG